MFNKFFRSSLAILPLSYAVIMIPENNTTAPWWYYFLVAAFIVVGLLQLTLPHITLNTVTHQRVAKLVENVTLFICSSMIGLLALAILISGGNW
jgi:hypothetical protein